MRTRIRTIKPEVFLDEELWDLAQETGLPLLQAFAGLWCCADREGRFEWRPRALKSAILPYWDGDMELLLEALERGRFIVSYVVDGRRYAYVRTFKDHQVVNAREAQSVLPSPESMCTHVQAHGEGNGRELEMEGNGNGDTREHADTRPAVWHTLEGWTIPEDLFAVAETDYGLTRAELTERVDKLRTGPIGGNRGVLDRTKYVRSQLGTWKVWGETERAKQRQLRAAGKIPVVVDWKPKDAHARYCAKFRLELATAAADFVAKGQLERYPAKELDEVFGRWLANLARAKRKESAA